MLAKYKSENMCYVCLKLIHFIFQGKDQPTLNTPEKIVSKTETTTSKTISNENTKESLTTVETKNTSSTITQTKLPATSELKSRSLNDVSTYESFLCILFNILWYILWWFKRNKIIGSWLFRKIIIVWKIFQIHLP